MKVLVACEESARVRDAFLMRGHDAWSCDLQPSSGDPSRHIQGDVLPVLQHAWDLVIAHPPCTFLCNSGVRHLYKKGTREKNQQRWQDLEQGRKFFLAMLEANAPAIVVENPIPHKYARLPKYTQIIQPWMFGDNHTKATCLWIQGLPLLEPEIETKPENVQATCHKMAPGPERAKLRSKTYPGIARAFAEQWG